MDTAYYKIHGISFCVVYEGNTICEISFAKETEKKGSRSAYSDRVRDELEEYLEGRRKTFDLKYCLKGTAFRMTVWNALKQIPYGETRSYKEIALEIGNPKAVRAVGMACHTNPIAVLVPCHRVIGSDGKITGYAGGVSVKEALLKLEADNAGTAEFRGKIRAR